MTFKAISLLVVSCKEKNVLGQVPTRGQRFLLSTLSEWRNDLWIPTSKQSSQKEWINCDHVVTLKRLSQQILKMLLQKDELKMLYSKIFSLSTNHCFKSRDRKTVLFSHLRFLFNYNQRICWKFPNWHFALKVETEVWSWRSKIVWAELQNHWQQIKTCCSKFVESIVFLYTI